MINKFTQKAQNTLDRALALARELGHTYVGSEHLLLGLLSEPDSIASRILLARGADAEAMKQEIVALSGAGSPSAVTAEDMTPRAKKIIESCAVGAGKNGNRYIGTEHILFALLGERDCVAVKLLETVGIPPNELKNDLTAFLETGEKNRSRDATKKDEEKLKIRGAPTISTYGRDLCAMAKEGKHDPVIGREREIQRLLCILSRRTKNNPCLIGEPGVGKTAVVEGLAYRICEGSVPETLQNRRIVTLDISAMLAGAKYRGEFEERMKNVMEEALKNPDIILFVDELHVIVGAGAAEGAVDAANIIKPALARSELQMIGATTRTEYHARIEKDAALARRFQAVSVDEPTPAEGERILFGLRRSYEEHHDLQITDDAIRAAVSLSVRYLPESFLPDKAIDLLDEAASTVRLRSSLPLSEEQSLREEHQRLSREKEDAIANQDFEAAARLRDQALALSERIRALPTETPFAPTVTDKDVAECLTARTGIPVCLEEGEDRRRLEQLEQDLKQRIVGQDEAVAGIARAIRRGRIGFRDPSRPVASFLLSGQTGVGKTALCRALSELLFSTSDALIRLDMSEYMEKHSVSKLIGSPPGYVGYGEGGQLTEKIRRRPYAVVLFDEIEKAHPDVFHLLLQILEDGTLTDSTGRRADFRNAVIIMTSNLGASCDRSPRVLGFTSEQENANRLQEQETLSRALREHFRPEFLNRIDEVLLFRPLTPENVEAIARTMLTEVIKRAERLEIELSFPPDAVTFLANKGYSATMGARPLRRTITRLVEDALSSAVLEGRIQAGDRVRAVTKEDALEFVKENALLPLHRGCLH